MKIEHQVAGRYKIEAVNSETGERRLLVDWFDNIITDIGLERMGIGDTVARCHVGSGSAEPLASNTGLQSPVAESNTVFGPKISGASGVYPYYGFSRITYRFAPGVATGNLSEVSVGWSTGNSSAFSRALIKDGGNPVTITVLPQDYLDVTYELRCYPPETDISFQAVIAGITHDCVARPSYVTSGYWWAPNFSGNVTFNNALVNSGDIGSISGAPTGSGDAGFPLNAGYVANSKRCVASLDWGLTVGNFAGGVKSLFASTSIGAWQCSFTPPIAKPVDNTKSLRLNVYCSWARKTLP